MKNNKYLLILLISLLLLVALFFFFNDRASRKKSSDINNDTVSVNQDEQQSEDENEKEVVHDLKLTIISPEEETFEKGQARMYNAHIEGNSKYRSALVKCKWEFFLKGSTQEVLYKEMESTGVLGLEPKDVCGFTSTFIEARGELRVKLTLTIYNYANEDLESVFAERMYTVE
ncbi:MAG: hypothetical protein WC981_01040 [Candidatus Dojkabacteria bacterium]